MIVLNVNSIATDADLANAVGGTENLNSLQASTTVRDTARSGALADVVGALAARMPPVRQGDLTDPTELKMAVVYRALHTICAVQVTMPGDRNQFLAVKFDKDYQAAMRAEFTVSPGVAGPGGWSIDVERG